MCDPCPLLPQILSKQPFYLQHIFLKKNVKEPKKDALLHILLRQKTGKLKKVLPLIVQQLFDSLSQMQPRLFSLGIVIHVWLWY